LLANWDKFLDIRSTVQKSLEEKRNEKIIGSSLEAKVTVKANSETFALLKKYEEQLASLYIVSEVVLEQAESDTLSVEVEHAAGAKCERCWNWSTTVGQDAQYPTLDVRCVLQIKEGWES
jgi:isoleucyl-tRNA synthetase